MDGLRWRMSSDVEAGGGGSKADDDAEGYSAADRDSQERRLMVGDDVGRGMGRLGRMIDPD